jgi:CheY-like chemotaxis protein
MEITFPLILIAESDADDRNCLQQAFEHINFSDNIQLFNSATDLTYYLKQLWNEWNLPSLILLNLDMPGVNGQEALFHLKKDDAFRHIPVVIYSLEMTKELERRLLTLGAEYCFKKPLTAAQSIWLAENLKALAIKSISIDEKAA